MVAMLLSIACSAIMFQPPTERLFPNSQPVVLPRCEQFDLTSKAGGDYRIFVQKPSEEPPAEGFGILYFVDGNSTFPLAVAQAAAIQRLTGPIVLVGIGYPTDDRQEMSRRRTFDLTPETPAEAILKFQQARRASSSRPSAKGLPPRIASEDMQTGGNEKLFEYIQNELKPLVESRIAIDKSKQAFFGHSYGGLFSLHLCLKHHEAFQFFAIASPSMWLNPTVMSAEEKEFADLLKTSPVKPRVVVTLGSEERLALGGDTASASQKPAAEELAERLRNLGIDASYREFPDENHGSVIPFALLHSIQQAFAATAK